MIKLSELPFEANILINGIEYRFDGYAKRRTTFGNQEHFIFTNPETKEERKYERYKFSTIKIKKNGNDYEWK